MGYAFTPGLSAQFFWEAFEIKKADFEKEPALSDKEKIEAEKEKEYRNDVEEKYDDWHDPVD